MEEITEDLLGSLTRAEKPTVRRSVDGLRGYLHIKGLFLQAKMSPTDNPLSDPLSLQMILEYLSTHTALRQYHFWRNLPTYKQALVCKKMTLRDEAHMRIIYKEHVEREGVICILLNGYAIESRRRQDPSVKMKIGNVFGPLAVLEAQAQSQVLEYVQDDYPVTVVIERGTILRLKIADVFKIMEPDYEEEEIVYDDEILPEDPWTFIERTIPKYITFPKKVTKELKDMMLQYKRIGNIGRKIMINKGDPSYVFILLTGEIRLVLSKSKTSKIKCKGSDHKKVELKNNKIPLLLLEPGSLFSLDDESFTVPEYDKPTNTKPKRVNMSIRIPPAPINFDDDKNLGTDVVNPEDLQFEMVFDRQTHYMAIPSGQLKSAMRESPHESFLASLGSISEFNESLSARMKSVEKWIHGGFATKSKPAYVKEDDIAPTADKPIVVSKYFQIKDTRDNEHSKQLQGSYYCYARTEGEVKAMELGTYSSYEDSQGNEVDGDSLELAPSPRISIS